MDGIVGRTARLIAVSDDAYCMTDAEAARVVARAAAVRAAAPDPASRAATVETLERRKHGDVVAALLSDGRLGRPQLDASGEILRVFEAITRGVAGRVTASYSERLPSSAAEDLPPSLRTAYVDRYAPWRAWSGRMAVTASSNLGDLTLLFVVDNMGPRQVEQSLRIRNGTAVDLLQKSLQAYAALAGWVKEFPLFIVRA